MSTYTPDIGFEMFLICIGGVAGLIIGCMGGDIVGGARERKEAQENIAKIECRETGHWSIKNNVITCLKPVENSDGNE